MPSSQHITTYSDIDWQQLWEQSRSQKTWKSKNAGQWDEKAPSFAVRMKESAYTDLFLDHLDIDESMSVLDVGCGPGTLAIPIAGKVEQVTAIDYSEKMLELLNHQASQAGIDNIRTVHCAWEDDWAAHDITTYDIVIASRSLNIRDMISGLKKLNHHADGRVYIAERIDPSPFDRGAFKAIGRPFNSGPDYIYTVNMLYHLGIHPRIDQMELSRELHYESMEHALNGYKWMFKELQPEEEKLLEKFLEQRIIRTEENAIIIRRDQPQRWALLSWTNTDR